MIIGTRSLGQSKDAQQAPSEIHPGREWNRGQRRDDLPDASHPKNAWPLLSKPSLGIMSGWRSRDRRFDFRRRNPQLRVAGLLLSMSQRDLVPLMADVREDCK